MAKFSLADFMTADQALKILEKLEKLEDLEKRLENAEAAIKALQYESTWGEIERETRKFIIEKEI